MFKFLRNLFRTQNILERQPLTTRNVISEEEPLVNIYNNFTIEDLQSICKSYGITEKRETKGVILQKLDNYTHELSEELLPIFRNLISQREEFDKFIKLLVLDDINLEILRRKLKIKEENRIRLIIKLLGHKKKVKGVIPKELKEIVWKHYIGNNVQGKCFCCNITEIKITSFHAGHVISEFEGGEISLENLRPICAKCNHSMRTKNMVEYALEKYGRHI